eukprot:4001671-Amphidinium_carterae.1
MCQSTLLLGSSHRRVLAPKGEGSEAHPEGCANPSMVRVAACGCDRGSFGRCDGFARGVDLGGQVIWVVRWAWIGWALLWVDWLEVGWLLGW